MKTSFEYIICPWCGKKHDPKDYIPVNAGDYDEYYIECENKSCKETIIINVNMDLSDDAPEGLSLYEYLDTNDICINTFTGEEDESLDGDDECW